jgi:branched-chain amino acid transport system ATP-binding protein
VLDNLRLGAFARRLRGAALQRRLMRSASAFPRLAERRSQRASTCRAASARCSRSAAR